MKTTIFSKPVKLKKKMIKTTNQITFSKYKVNNIKTYAAVLIIKSTNSSFKNYFNKINLLIFWGESCK